ELMTVVFEPRKKLSAAFARDGLVLGGECERVLLETFDAEEFCLEWFLVGVVRRLTDQRRQRFEDLIHEADVCKVLHNTSKGPKTGEFQNITNLQFSPLWLSYTARDARFGNRSGKSDHRLGRCRR